MKSKSIITGQTIRPAKLVRAREMRRQMTVCEAVLWEQLRANRFHGLHFRRQQIIDGFIVDFYSHAARLVIEVDGLVHLYQKESDLERDAILSKRGLCILRFSNEEIERNMQLVLNKINDNVNV